MARPTRSGDAATKKRKRISSPHDRPHKLPRPAPPPSHSLSSLPPDHASRILHVLENSDALGLLDRVFPLSPPSHSARSLRSLLADAQPHALRVLRAAIYNLRPLSSHPRSKPSETASQQLRFCNLALSLLDQASRDILPVSLDTLTLVPHHPHPPSDHPKSPLAEPRYALVQHLPAGDYWSSLNSPRPSSPSLHLKDLSTAHAELVSILPTPSSSQTSKPTPTLASYNPTKSHPNKALPAQRRLTTGAFLDYGPWASFAPSFDHDCELVGRRELGQALWYKRERNAHRDAQLREWIQGKASIVQVDNVMAEDEPFDAEAEFSDILSPETIQNLKAALDDVELEKLVDELLTRNQRALVRLQELQIDRLTKEDLTIDETSEEWEIAHGIMESLETLTSLRPRAASGEVVSVVPPTFVLRKLHKALALEPQPGWYGTLAPTRSTALRDDSTAKVRASSTVPATVSTSSSPAPTSITPVASAAAPTTTPYAGYTYAYQAQQAQAYRPVAATATTTGATTYTPYKPGATPYYQNYMQSTTQQQQQQQQQYYGQQAYGAGATSQQPYAAYSSWFAHAQYSQAAAAATTGTASTGPGTPQPATAAAYGSYYQQPAQQQRPAGSTTGAAAATPAVANTAAMNKAGTGVTAGAWAGYTGQPQGSVAPTLPVQMRATTGVPIANGYQSQPQQGYYGAYQVQPQAPAK